uniref:Uncharacterized protein n=1 Tax=Timema bartmani TaxID=61472 RepID=A0A7R9FC39_9NEOP|nr:unnamed protein product [Timema bartmani]
MSTIGLGAGSLVSRGVRQSMAVVPQTWFDHGTLLSFMCPRGTLNVQVTRHNGSLDQTHEQSNLLNSLIIVILAALATVACSSILFPPRPPCYRPLPAYYGGQGSSSAAAAAAAAAATGSGSGPWGTGGSSAAAAAAAAAASGGAANYGYPGYPPVYPW